MLARMKDCVAKVTASLVDVVFIVTVSLLVVIVIVVDSFVLTIVVSFSALSTSDKNIFGLTIVQKNFLKSSFKSRFKSISMKLASRKHSTM